MIDPLRRLRDHQAGVCAICERADKPLVVDHDHVTGLVRGLLCCPCNVSEGHSDFPWMRSYRASPPAAKLGLVVKYGRHHAWVSRPARRVDHLLAEPGWLERLMANPVGPPLDPREYLTQCDDLGYCHRPCDVSADVWRARLEVAGLVCADPWPTETPFERRCALHAASQEQRDREGW